MIIDHPDGLHESIANCRADEIKTAVLQIAAQGVGFSGGGRNWRAAVSPQRFSFHKFPNVRVETAEFFLHGQKRARVLNGGSDFQTIANDSFVVQQFRDFAPVVVCNFRGIEVVESSPVVLTLPQDGFPIEARLRTLEDQQLEQLSIIMDRHTPFTIMVRDGQIGPRPAATN